MSARCLWMVLYEADGITGELIHEEANRLGLLSGNAKLNDLSDDDSEELRRACFARAGLTEAETDRRFRSLPFVEEWHRQRRRHPPLFWRRSDREIPRKKAAR